MSLRYLLLIAIYFSSFTSALATPTRDDFQLWQIITLQPYLDNEKNYSLYVEAQPREGRDATAIERFILRYALNYHPTTRHMVSIGHAWTPQFLDTNLHHDYRDEHRVWQQFLYTHTLDNQASIIYRFRQEQRFIESTNDTSHRSRLLTRVSKPVFNGTSAGLTGYQELFVNLNSVQRGPRGGFDRYRFFFGPYYQQGPLRYEIGYLGEYGKRFGNADRMLHGIVTSIGITF